MATFRAFSLCFFQEPRKRITKQMGQREKRSLRFAHTQGTARAARGTRACRRVVNCRAWSLVRFLPTGEPDHSIPERAPEVVARRSG